MLNLFGFDVDAMDVPRFLSLTRVAFVGLAFWGVALAARSRDQQRAGRVVLAVAALGHFLAWLATMFPLPDVYGTNGSMDRENHLGFANVVAEGFSPLRTFQVNHLHFEPLWPLLTALVSGFSVDRIELVFQFAPLIVGLALLGSVRFAWMNGGSQTQEGGVEASFAAMGALLLMAVPGDFSGPFRNPWALMFLLKPNHALGLVLIPLAALAIARSRTWKTRLLAGFVLQLVGWAFVIHMALFVVVHAVFVALSWLTRAQDRKRDLTDAGVAVGVNLLIVSPYLVLLAVAYPIFAATNVHGLSFLSERPLEAPMRLGVLFLLGAFGAWTTYRNGTRLGRILSSQWLTAQIIWQLYPVLGLFGLAREQDEVFYWCRFWMGLFAGVGMFRAALLAQARFQGSGTSRVPGRSGAAGALILLLPSLLPAWWDPQTMDQYFVAAREPKPDWIAEPTRFIRTSTPREAVFAGDKNYARWIAAYGARRVLLSNSLNRPADHERRNEIGTALLRGGAGSSIVEGQAPYGITHLLMIEHQLWGPPEVAFDVLKAQPHLETVYDQQFDDARVLVLKVRRETGP